MALARLGLQLCVLGTTMAWLGDLHRSGAIRIVSFSEYEEIYGL